MNNIGKIAVKPAEGCVVYSDFKDGFKLDPNEITYLVDTHWVRKRIQTGELVVCSGNDKPLKKKKER